MSGRVGVEGRGAVVRQALGNPALRRVLAAYLLFNVAEWATWIGLLVWGFGVGGVRGSSEIALVQLVPGALLAAPTAALLGRLPRGRALFLGYTAQTLGFLMVGLALVTDAPVAVVGATAALSAVTVSLTRPVHNALLPEISRTTADLTAGNAASGSLEALATFLGPLASGLLLAVWGAGGVLLAMSVCSAVGAALTARLVTAAPRRAAVRRTADGPQGSLRTVLRNPAARLMSLLIAAEYALVGMMDILLVVLALDVLGMSDAGPGVLNSAIGVGGIAGAALTFTLIGRPRLAGPLVLGALCAGLAFALAGQAGTPVVALVLVAVSGAGKLFYDVASRTFVQRLLPDHLLTAMFGLQESFTMTGIALGTLAAPILVGLVGAQGAFLAAGSFLPLTALASYAVLRRLDAGTAVPVDVLELLMQVPTLAVLAPRIVERMARDAVVVHVPTGQGVVQQGDVGTRFYVIATGRVSVAIDGSEIRELGPGGWFGEIALLRDVPRTASVTALTDVSLWGVDRESFLASVTAVSRSVELADTHIRDKYV
jgi:MFS family permease